MVAHECPSCRWKLAYVGFTAVECANKDCSFYNERWYAELADAWMTGKFDWPGYGLRKPGVVTKLELELLPQPSATPEIWTPDHELDFDWMERDDGEPFFGVDRSVEGTRLSGLTLASFDAFLKQQYTQDAVNRLFLPTLTNIFLHPSTYQDLVEIVEEDECNASRVVRPSDC